MKFDFPNAVAVVTGAGSVIGAASARSFAKRGARVVVTDIDAARAATVAARGDTNSHEALGGHWRTLGWSDLFGAHDCPMPASVLARLDFSGTYAYRSSRGRPRIRTHTG
jgi:NAD(P)-dependent dehydrogenase (short-subunit alcohol dehydrogenase family)